MELGAVPRSPADLAALLVPRRHSNCLSVARQAEAPATVPLLRCSINANNHHTTGFATSKNTHRSRIKFKRRSATPPAPFGQRQAAQRRPGESRASSTCAGGLTEAAAAAVGDGSVWFGCGTRQRKVSAPRPRGPITAHTMWARCSCSPQQGESLGGGGQRLPRHAGVQRCAPVAAGLGANHEADLAAAGQHVTRGLSRANGQDAAAPTHPSHRPHPHPSPLRHPHPHPQAHART